VALQHTDGVLQVRNVAPNARRSQPSLFLWLLSRRLLPYVKGPAGSWLCVLEVKRKQEGAELQIARFYYDFIRALAGESRSLLVRYPHLPCISVEIAGNDMR
jgi:hypothetical protein